MENKLNVPLARQILQEAGYKHTKQRDIILEILENNTNHPTPDDIIQIIKDKLGNVTVATVYNTLEVLTKEGLIKKIEGLETKNHYDPFLKPHYHAICTKCKKVFDIETPCELGINLPDDFILSDCLIQGICKDCKKS